MRRIIYEILSSFPSESYNGIVDSSSFQTRRKRVVPIEVIESFSTAQSGVLSRTNEGTTEIADDGKEIVKRREDGTCA